MGIYPISGNLHIMKTELQDTNKTAAFISRVAAHLGYDVIHPNGLREFAKVYMHGNSGKGYQFDEPWQMSLIFEHVVLNVKTSPYFNMGVSISGGYPKWIVYNGKSY